MNRLRKKTMVTLLTAIFMISTFAVVMPVSADDLEKPEVMARAMGQFTSMFAGDPYWSQYPPTEGDRCLISIHAKRDAIGWTGQGVFRDKDYELTAILTVDSANDKWLIYGQVILSGDAEVYVDGEFIAIYRFNVIIVDGYYVNIEIMALKYFSCVYGPDISVKTTVKVME